MFGMLVFTYEIVPEHQRPLACQLKSQQKGQLLYIDLVSAHFRSGFYDNTR